MQVSEPDLTYGNYTYADYLLWTIEERFELIKGKVFKMSPAPNTRHQLISQRLNRQLLNYFYKKPCQVFAAPFDIRLPRKSKKHEDIITVVQPDISVVCDAEKIDDKGCIGAPDIVIEILSPGNNQKELKNKYEIYEEAGVKEYWIIHPQEKTFMRYLLKKGAYQPTKLLTLGDIVTSDMLPFFKLPLDEVFED